MALFGAEGLESRSLSTELLGLACFPCDARHLIDRQAHYENDNFNIHQINTKQTLTFGERLTLLESEVH